MNKLINKVVSFIATRRFNLIDMGTIIILTQINEVWEIVDVMLIGAIISISFEAMHQYPLNEEPDHG
jgi:hypothetical protein